ncbi:hypothetical protein [Pedobacter sp. NJ-S-72]
MQAYSCKTAGTPIQNSKVVIDKNYKFPQVFRADVAIEKNLGNGFAATFEAIYTKDINATRMRNAAFSPWYNCIDANILQDFYIKSGNTKHTLQLSAVVINLPDLLSKNWGIKQFNTTNSPLSVT